MMVYQKVVFYIVVGSHFLFTFYPLPRSSANMHFIIMCSYRNKSRFESLFKSVVMIPVAEAPRTLVELIGLVLWYRVTLMITIELRVLRAVNAC